MWRALAAAARAAAAAAGPRSAATRQRPPWRVPASATLAGGAARPAGCCGARGWASSSGSSSGGGGSGGGERSFKEQLRKLYRLIHPDFFHDWPAEREENERSFALLQEYLSALQEGRPGAGGHKLFNFVFYLRKAPHSYGDTSSSGNPSNRPTESPSTSPDGSPSGSGAPAAGGAEEEELGEEVLEGLYRVAVTLPPPQAGRGRHSEEASRLALGKLLRAVGLTPDLSALGAGPGGGGGGAAGGKRALQHILEDNAEAVRRNEARARGLTAQMAMARAAMRLGRRVVFSISAAGAGALPAEAEAELHLRFAATCDALAGADLAGLRVVAGGAYGVDVAGTLWLDAAQPAREWAAWLSRNLDHARQKQASTAALRAIEADVAAALGVGMVFTSRLLSRSDPYRQFLERAAAVAAADGPIGGAARPFRRVPLCAVAPGGWEVTPLGGLSFPVSAGAEEVAAFVGRRGAEAAAILERRAAEEAARREVVETARRALRLRHLVADKALPPARFEAAAKRLLGYAPELAAVVEGMSICVSDSHGVTPDGSMVALAWDFTLSG
eukprot:jgi/Tetstr1/445839/TSEL_033479.t1